MPNIKLYRSLENEIKANIPYVVGGLIITQCPFCLNTSICSGNEILGIRMYCNGILIRHESSIYHARQNEFQYKYEGKHEVRRANRIKIVSIDNLRKVSNV